jgi:Outer membrane protein beta-barrel domain
MKKLFTVLAALTIITTVFAQKKDTVIVNTPTVAEPKKKDWSKIDLSHRANDHFMLQIGYDNWNGKPDTLNITGFSRSFNFYFMLDFPFKSDPRLSVGAGLGIGNSNIFFKNQPAPINVLPQQDGSGGSHFKKYKLVTTYLEIPLELRFALDPENTNKSWKFALGVKVGTMLSAYAKGKSVENGSGQVQDASVYKVSNKSDFNNIKLAGTIRISKGPFGVFGQYNITSLIKGSAGPIVYPFSFGICFSGL